MNQTAIALLCDAAIIATIRHGTAKGIEFNADKLAPIARQVIKAEIVGVMNEWETAIKANISEANLRHMMNVQANWLAAKIITAYQETR